MFIRKLINYWISRERSGFYTFLAIVCIGSYWLGIMIGNSSPLLSWRLKLGGFLGFLALAVLFFIHRNLNSYYEFLGMFKDTDHLPQKQISFVNSFCMTVFLIAALAAILIAAFATQPLWDAISDWYSRRPRAEIVREIPVETEPYVPEPRVEHPDLQALLGQPVETPDWVKVLNNVTELAAAFITLAAIFIALRHMSNRVWTYITKPRLTDEDEKIYLKPTLDLPLEFRPGEGEDGQKKGLRYYLSYTARLRRYYKKQILKGRRQQRIGDAPPEWASPRELEQSAALDNAVLHALYEKARYSGQECTEEDWRRACSDPAAEDEAEGESA